MESVEVQLHAFLNLALGENILLTLHSQTFSDIQNLWETKVEFTLKLKIFWDVLPCS
jgi:hypothetical protein